MILAGDVGATKTALGIYSADRGVREPLLTRTVQNAGYADFESIVREFLDDAGLVPESACIGVAGPVEEGRSSLTNLPWVVDAGRLRNRFSLSQVRIINDLQAVVTAVPLLALADLHVLHDAQRVPGGTMAVIAPGTGLGEAFSVWDGFQYQPRASEGGHADFAPGSELEIALLRDLLSQEGHVSWESLCSGRGIPRLYRFLKDRGFGEEPAPLAANLKHAEDPTPLIVAAALDPQNPCALCVGTLDLFASILGAEAGNLALKVLATGGVYLAGGITRHVLPFLEKGAFVAAFRRKGRMSDFVSRMPVYTILHDDIALTGAAAHALLF